MCVWHGFSFEVTISLGKQFSLREVPAMSDHKTSTCLSAILAGNYIFMLRDSFFLIERVLRGGVGGLVFTLLCHSLEHGGAHAQVRKR